jgi:hypothetical protein
MGISRVQVHGCLIDINKLIFLISHLSLPKLSCMRMCDTSRQVFSIQID